MNGQNGLQQQKPETDDIAFKVPKGLPLEYQLRFVIDTLVEAAHQNNKEMPQILCNHFQSRVDSK